MNDCPSRFAHRIRALRCDGFTLIELLTVIALILILVGITIGAFSYANNKARRSRAEGEISALSAAIENYKLDNGEYPHTSETDGLDPQRMFNPAVYQIAGQKLYYTLSGRDQGGALQAGAKSYYEFKTNQTLTDPATNQTILSDPFGKSYGYSTARDAQMSPPRSGTGGYNPTFDLWSTAGQDALDAKTANRVWIKNW